MNNTIFKITVAIGLALSSLQAADKPNILFIAVDDLKPDLGCYGNTYVKTPNFDRLAKMGVTFTNSHCNQAVCGPSRASLMTGLRPDRTKVHDLKTKTREVTPWITTLPEHFKNNGYITAGTGKIYDPRSVDKKSDKPSWSLPFRLYNLDYNPDFPEPASAAYQGAEIQKAVKEIKDSGVKGYGPILKELIKRDLHPATESADVPDDAYTDGAIRKEGIKFIQKLAKQDKPFFLAVGFKKPHLPFVAPKKYWDLYKREEIPLAKFQEFAKDAPEFAYHDSNELRSYGGIPAKGKMDEAKSRELIHGYYACISYIDTQIGMLLDELDKQGLSENTIVILWGDHGWHLGDHGIWCKHTNYEEATRSPLIYAGPGIQKGKKTHAPTEFVDIFPTLCDLADIPTIENLDGTSSKPVLDGSKDKVKDYAVSQFSRGKAMGYAFRDEQYRYVFWVNNAGKIGSESTPSTEVNKLRAQELYDYKADPLETVNIAKDPAQAERIKALKKEANAFLKAQAERIAKEPKAVTK